MSKLRFRITLQKQTSVRDEQGNVVTSWSDMGTVWSSYEPNPNRWREFFSGDATISESYARFTARYRTDITPANRLVFENKIYDIVNVVDDSKKKYVWIIGKVSENGE
ncbi:phage head closure protein [Thermoactinomyces sp. DSM 45892]|uniref:phage head closure protein n=1 Tax=Thermoactinomyces sp. DSM 45892 TaxID=1882753 RepID=UPI00089D11E9|nr:phage head closure protein [Thermoactinomyces sp. DSM 45892]SDY69414.1 phage head-tail adaptor, putative, SPP1 family [Thermoactinomyces sp. DSM 45892]